MDYLVPHGFYCTNPQPWCITSPPLLPENSYMLAFRLPLLEKIDIIRKSRSRFHTFNHCQYCTRDLILFSLLRSDVFAIDRLQLLTILEKDVPQGGKFACKGQVEHWLGIIDIGSVATVEKLPVLRNRLESTEYFFLQNSLFKIFAHFLEDSCTEILDEVRCDLVNMLEDLKQNEESFKSIITTCQIKFRNNLNKLNNDILPFRNTSPNPSIGLHRTLSGSNLETTGTINSAIVPILAISDSLLTPQNLSHGYKSDSEIFSNSGNCTVNDAYQIGNLTGISLFNNSRRISSPYLSPIPGPILPKMLSPIAGPILPKMLSTPSSASPQGHSLSPALSVSILDDLVYSKRSSHNKLNHKLKATGNFDPVASI